MNLCKSNRCAPLVAVVGVLALTMVEPLWGADALAQPTTIEVHTRDELRQAVASAKPGTTISLAPGTYHGDLSFPGLQGTKERPIVLRALDPKRPPVIEGDAVCIHLSDPAYVELEDLELAGARGNGLNVDDGGSPDSPAHHLVFRRLKLHDVGPSGNCDGMKLSGVDSFLIDGCTIERWGDNGSAIDMVGCHEGEIRDCIFRHRGDIPANGVQTKGGSAKILIKRSRFENAGSRAVNIGGSTGADYFRPLMADYEARDITVEDCTFIGSMAPIVFVGVDRAIVRHNTIYRPTRWVIRILQESRAENFAPCRNGVFTNNLIVFRSDELRTAVNAGEGTRPETFTFANNYWYCLDNPAQSGPHELPVEETGGHYGANPQFIDEQQGDLRMGKTSPVRAAGVRLQPR